MYNMYLRICIKEDAQIQVGIIKIMFTSYSKCIVKSESIICLCGNIQYIQYENQFLDKTPGNDSKMAEVQSSDDGKRSVNKTEYECNQREYAHSEMVYNYK